MEIWQGILLIALFVVSVINSGVNIYLIRKNKKSNSNSTAVETNEVKPEPTEKVVIEILQLNAVKLLPGSNEYGYETNEELKARLDSLSKEEFLALDLNERPYTSKEWDAIYGDDEAIQKRNEYELGIFYAYNFEGVLKIEAGILRREIVKTTITNI